MDINYFLSNNIMNIILAIIIIFTIYSVVGNKILYHRNIFKKYIESKYENEIKSRKKLIILNCMFLLLIIFYFNYKINYSDLYVIISILTTGIIAILTSINTDKVSKYIDNKNSNNIKKIDPVGNTNNISIFNLFLAGLIIIILLISQSIDLMDNPNFNKIFGKAILLLVFLFTENFIILTRRYVTIFIKINDNNF